MLKKVKVGVIGCGAVSGAYLGGSKNFSILDVVACADLDDAKAKAAAQKFGIPHACSVKQLLADPAIEIVLNLTNPKAHAPLAIETLMAGKHTYIEKPLGTSRIEGEKIMRLAAKKKLYVGCAPDTFLGAAAQTARKLIDDGAIGQPVAFTAFMLCRGHEAWHPNPDFYYQPGGGPMFDMGPYYLTTLMSLLGSVKHLTAMASIAIPERIITSAPKFGVKIKVHTPDHICGGIEFENGVVGTIMTSFATMHPTVDPKHPIAIYGTEGTLRLPDPNAFDGTVSICLAGESKWRDVPHTALTGYSRSIGLADLAYAVRTGRPARAGGEQALAVLDVMQGFLDSAEKGKFFAPSVPYARPKPMPAKLPFGTLDE